MNKPNFQAMTRKELLTYMLEHRDDDEAFHIYMDRVHTEPPTEIYPAPQSIDDLKHFPQLLEKHRKEREGNI
jgi:hypothetical protein